MKKIVIILILSLGLLISCGQNTQDKIEVSYDVSAYHIESVASVQIEKGASLPLPVLEDDWLDFKGWYLDPNYEISATDISLVDEDTTLYALFEPSLTIAVIGDGSKAHFHDVLSAIEDYSNTHNRLYKVYEWGEMVEANPRDFNPTETAIEDAAALGIDLMFLTESFQQSEEVYEAQAKYPDINFVLNGYEPREHFFFGEPVILENTISTKVSASNAGFLAGYIAVLEGYQHLGFFGSNGSRDFESSIGFIAGAYYGAHQLEREIFFNERSFKIIESTTFLLSEYFAEGAYETGTELIYTPSSINSVIEQVALENNGHVILSLNSQTDGSEAVCAVLEDSNYLTTIDILNDFFSRSFKGGDYLDNRVILASEISSIGQVKLETYQTLLETLYNGELDVPTNYDDLILFLQALDMMEVFSLDVSIVESISMFPFD